MTLEGEHPTGFIFFFYLRKTEGKKNKRKEKKISFEFGHRAALKDRASIWQEGWLVATLA